MTFKFQGHHVSFVDGKLHSDDEVTQLLLTPLIRSGSCAPEDGDPLLNGICSVFGSDSITDVVDDDYDPYLIY